MKTKTGRFFNLLLTLILIIWILSATVVFRASAAPGIDTTAAPAPPEGERSEGRPSLLTVQSGHNDISPPLRALKPLLPAAHTYESPQHQATADPSFQTQSASSAMPSPLRSFEGISNVDGTQPPDPQGDVGTDHYVQWVNRSFAIWDKEGTLLYGPANGNTLWTEFGGPCETTDDDNPTTLYDHLADRWLMSQVAHPNFPLGPFYQCIAISQTGDPTGAWYRYEFPIPVSKGNHHPTFGLWPDGYYMSCDQSNNGSLTWGGPGVAAFERDKMLQGKVAQMVYVDVGAVNPNFGGMLPADLDGPTLPLDGSPNYFVATDSGHPGDTLRLWEFHADWTNPADSTFGLAGHMPNSLLPTTDVDSDMCQSSADCIPQPRTTQKLDAVSDRLMARLQYRNFGPYETLVTNRTVDADNTDHAGIHWMELRRQAGPWSVHQEGIYAPDPRHRWVGSIAMDQVGNTALGYSLSSAVDYPSIRYTGRLAYDPPGTMGQGESTLIDGTGSQTNSNHWGTHSSLAVDPADDCTFWYTQKYYQTSGSNWRTRVGAFRFPNCTVEPQGTLTGVIYESGGTPATQPIAGASVWVDLGPGQTLRTITGADGRYRILLPTGTQTVNSMAHGYQPGSSRTAQITAGTTTTLDIPLAPASAYVIEGSVTDADVGWPLYAHITVQGDPVNPPAPYNSFWNDPVTGYYSATLAEGIRYTFDVKTWLPGYLLDSRDVGPLAGAQVEEWTLHANPAGCTAPSYSLSHIYSEDFEASGGGYTHSGPNDEWEWGTPIGWPNGCASGNRCWGTNLGGNYANNADQSLYSPVIDLSGLTDTVVTARWWQAWDIESPPWDEASVDVSINGDLWSRIWSSATTDTSSDWTEMSYDISDAAGGSVQFRWRVVSESTITYEGMYVDDVTITAGCVPSAGGLVVGNAYDDNTQAPLVGANVTSDEGSTTTAPSPSGDLGIDDGFYTLFSPPGAHTFAATTSEGYGTDTVQATVIQSATVRQDFYLPAGRLSHTPDSLAVTLEMGGTTAVPLTLTNVGGLPLTFQLGEEETGFQIEPPPIVVTGRGEWLYRSEKSAFVPQDFMADDNGTSRPAYPVAYRWESDAPSEANILIYADDDYHVPPNTYLDGALQALGLSYTAHYDDDWSGFETDLTSGGPWDLVLVGNEGWRPPESVLNALNRYVTQGGKLVYHGWTVSQTSNHPLWTTLGLTWIGDDTNPPDPIYWWVRGHPFFTAPESVPDFTEPTSKFYYVYGQRVEPLPGFQALAGYTTPGPDPDAAALILGNNNRTVFKGFLDGQNDADIDGDNRPDGIELWINLISGLLSSASSVDWLSEEPTTSSLGVNDQQVVSIQFDAGAASVMQPGEYAARLTLNSDTPYDAINLPVTMTVPPPDTWGLLRGTVFGLGHCDADPTPLEDVTMVVTGTSGRIWEPTTGISGTYSLWLEQGTYPIAISAADHRSVIAAVDITAQTTKVQDFDLRSIEPCISVAPQSIAATLIPCTSKTRRLTVTNTGAGASLYSVSEPQPVGVPWLSIYPIAGTVEADSAEAINVTFTPPRSMVTGTYTATLEILTDDAGTPLFHVPVTLTVPPSQRRYLPLILRGT